MKVIARPQCTEKTKDLIEFSIEHNIPIFCLTESKRRSLYEKAIAYFSKTVEVICAEELLHKHPNAVLVDDAEEFIKAYINDYSTSPVELAGFTVTTEN